MVSTPRIDRLDAGNNIIINGNFDFWQRGISFPAIASTSYSADRMQYNKGGTMVHTVSRSTDVPTLAQSGSQSVYSYRALVTTAQAVIGSGDFCAIQYKMEGLDYSQIHGKPIRLQFWVKNSVIGLHSIAFRNGAANRSYITTYTINVANTWEKKFVDVMMDTSGSWSFDNSTGVNISFALAGGSTFQTSNLNQWQSGNFIAATGQVNGVATISNSFHVAQVQLVQVDLKSDSDMIFKRAGRNISDELAMCQRYYWRLGAQATGADYQIGLAWALDSSSFQFHYKLPTTMRAIPTLGGSLAVANPNASVIAIGNLVASQSNVDGFAAGFNGASGLTASQVYRALLQGNTGQSIVADAEL